MPAHALCVYGIIGHAYNLYHNGLSAPVYTTTTTALTGLYEPIPSHLPTESSYFAAPSSVLRHDVCDALDRPIDNTTITCELPEDFYYGFTSDVESSQSHVADWFSVGLILDSSKVHGIAVLRGLGELLSYHVAVGALLPGVVVLAILFWLVYLEISQLKETVRRLSEAVQAMQHDQKPNELDSLNESLELSHAAKKPQEDEVPLESQQSASGDDTVTHVEPLAQPEDDSATTPEQQHETQQQDEQGAPLPTSPEALDTGEQDGQQENAGPTEASASLPTREASNEALQDDAFERTMSEAQNCREEEADLEEPPVPDVILEAPRDPLQDSTPEHIMPGNEAGLQESLVSQPAREPRSDSPQHHNALVQTLVKSQDGVMMEEYATRRDIIMAMKRHREAQQNAIQPDLSLRVDTLPPEGEAGENNEDGVHDHSEDDGLDFYPEPTRADLPHNSDSASDVDAPENDGLKGENDDSDDDDNNDPPSSGAALSVLQAQVDEQSTGPDDRLLFHGAADLESLTGAPSDSLDVPALQPQHKASHDEHSAEVLDDTSVTGATEPLSTQHEDEDFGTTSAPLSAGEVPLDTAHDSSASASASSDQNLEAQAPLSAAVFDDAPNAEQQDIVVSASGASSTLQGNFLPALPPAFVFGAGNAAVGVEDLQAAPAGQLNEPMETEHVDRNILVPSDEVDDEMDVDKDELLALVTADLDSDSEEEQQDDDMNDVSDGTVDDDEMNVDERDQEDEYMSEASDPAPEDTGMDDEEWNDFVEYAEAEMLRDSDNQGEIAQNEGSNHATEQFDQLPVESETESLVRISDSAPPLSSGGEWPDSKNTTYYHPDSDEEKIRYGDGLDDSSDDESEAAGPSVANKVDDDRNEAATTPFLKDPRTDFPTEAEVQASLPPHGIEPDGLLVLFGERVPVHRTKEFFLLVSKVGKVKQGIQKYFPGNAAGGAPETPEAQNSEQHQDSGEEDSEDDAPHEIDDEMPTSEKRYPPPHRGINRTPNCRRYPDAPVTKSRRI